MKQRLLALTIWNAQKQTQTKGGQYDQLQRIKQTHEKRIGCDCERLRPSNLLLEKSISKSERQQIMKRIYKYANEHPLIATIIGIALFEIVANIALFIA